MTRNRNIFFAIFFFILNISLIKSQTSTVIFQPGVGGSKDAVIKSISPTTNFGTSTSLEASRDASNNRVRGNLQFDLSSIPSDAIISSALLTLYGLSHTGVNPSYLRQNTASWSDAIVTWNTFVATTTVGQISLAQSTSPGQNYILDVKSFVQGMVNIPSSNYGFTLIRQTETTTGGLLFGSSDNTTAGVRPKLVVSYSLPMDVKGYMTPSTGSSAANGAINVTIQNGVAPFTYSWSDGSTTKDIFNKTPGAYTLLVTDNLGNQVKKHFFIAPENTPMVVSITPDALSGKDAMVQIRDNGTLIYNSYKDNINTQATRGTASGWLTSRSLLEFDLFCIPTNAIVSSASLQLYGNGHNPLNRPNDAYLLQNNGAWTESTICWGTQPGNVLTTPAIYLPGTTSANENTTIDVTSPIQKWVQDPSKNQGWKLQLADETTASYTILYYGSSDNTNAALRPTLSFAITIPVPLDAERNWTMEETYDQYGQVIATTKLYADALGRSTQAHSKNANGDVFTTQTIYDAYGRAAINTLPAYTGNTLTYNSQFMLNTFGQEYNYTNFDIIGKISSPDPIQVGQVNTLGTYYSDLNTLDAWQATATNPYTRSHFMSNPYGEVKTTNGADDAFKAGANREVRNYSMVCGDELKYILGATNSYKVKTTVGAPLITTPLTLTASNYIRASKSITTSPDNKEVVSYSVGDKVIATCMSGLNSPDNCSMTTVQNYMNWYGTQSIDIHLPHANKASLSLPLPVANYGGGTLNFQNSNVSYAITDMRTETVLQNPTDYSINVSTRVVTFSPAYLAANLGKPLFLRLKMAYQQTVVDDFIANGYTLPNCTVQYDLDYGRWGVNYYDVAGNLRKSVSPKGMSCASPGVITMATVYDYSHLGQLIAKQTPDEGLSEYAYDLNGNARFAQTPTQKLNNKFSYSHYDLHGRVTETGEFSNTPSAGSNGLYFQNYYNNYTAPYAGNIATSTILDNADGLLDSYCNDTYFTSYEALSAIDDVPSTYSYASQYLGLYKNGQVSKTWNANTTTWYKYNQAGQLFASIKQVNDADYATYAGTGDLSIKTYENTYDPYFGNVTNNYYQKNISNEYAEHQFTYDVNKRLTQVDFTPGLGNTPTTISKLFYDKLGRTKRQELGNALQGIDYVYTLNNTLKAINHPSLSWDKDRGQDHIVISRGGLRFGVNEDLFGEVLEYYPNDYQRSYSNIETNTNGLYNGQIYGQRYKTRNVVNGINTGADYIDYLGANQVQLISATNYTQQEIANRYTYDQFNQLATSTFGTYNNTINSFTARTDYKEYGVTGGAIAYDPNGNITRLQRNSYNVASATQLLDNLTYNYTTTSNKHNQVVDAAVNSFASSFNFKNQTGTAATFVYNAKGQLTSSPDEKITGITYYPNGQIKQISFVNGNTTNHYYDDQGQKYKTKYYDNATSNTKYNWYLFNAIYQYETNLGTFDLKEVTVGGQGRVGVYKQDIGGIKISTGHLQYELKDHLGNVRVTFTEYVDAYGTHSPQVVSKTDYYAFGGTLPGRIWQDAGGDYRYGYQGQEKCQSDINWDDFELRTYNHDLGRWSAPDPYGQFHSPYLAMGNNPVSNIDPDGGFTNNASSGAYSQYWRNIGAMQRKADDYLRFLGAGKYSQEAMYESYLEKFDQLYSKDSYGNYHNLNVTGEGRDVAVLNAIYELNNEYIGMGLAASRLGSGLFMVSDITRSVHSDLMKRNSTQNGEAESAANAINGLNSIKREATNFEKANSEWAAKTSYDARNRHHAFLAESKRKAQDEYDAEQKVKEAAEKIDPVGCNLPGSERAKFHVKLPKFSISKKYGPTTTRIEIIKTITNKNGFGPFPINIPGNRSAVFSIGSKIAIQPDAFSLVNQLGNQLNPGVPFGDINISFPQNTPLQNLILNVTPFVPLGSTFIKARAADVYSVDVVKTYVTRRFVGYRLNFNGWE